MSIIHEFKSIKRILDRQEQKAEFEAKNPPAPMWFNTPIRWTPEHGYGNAGPR